MTPKSIEFDAILIDNAGKGAYIIVPADIITILQIGGRAPVAVTFEGESHRGSVVTMGKFCRLACATIIEVTIAAKVISPYKNKVGSPKFRVPSPQSSGFSLIDGITSTLSLHTTTGTRGSDA